MTRTSRIAALCAALLSAATARAQAVPNDGWAADRYEPAPTGDVFFASDHPWYSATRAFAGGLTLDHAVSPLVFRDSAGASVAAIGHMLTGHFGAVVSFADRVGVGVSLPVALLQDGSPVTVGASTVGAASGVAIGDLRATARVRIAGQSDVDAFSLHAAASVWVPLGARATNTGDASVRVEPRLIAAGRGGPVRWSATVSYHRRPDHVAAQVAVSQELRASVAIGVVALDERLTIGPEAWAYTALGDPLQQGRGAFSDGLWGAEAIVGAHLLAAHAVLIGVGGGAGFGNGYGVPAARLLATVAYAPVRNTEPVYQRPLDSDGDDVGDPDDQCPTTPRGAHPDTAREGCPAADSDGDGLLDADDRCVSEPQGAQPDPTRAGCPLRDRDSDGLFDPDDTCPEQPAGPSPDPTRRGCPSADRDRDGVADHEDLCPDVAASTTPDTARRGCPTPDGDRDMVPDARDACPTVAGVPSEEASRSGCVNPRVRIVAGEVRGLAPIVFHTNEDGLKHESARPLALVAGLLRGTTYVRRLAIEGHTDERATPERAQALSEERARSVMRWLIQHGVAAERLEARGFGQTRPIAPNHSEEDRLRNQRVEFRVVDPAPATSEPASAPSAPAREAPTTVAAPERHRRRRSH